MDLFLLFGKTGGHRKLTDRVRLISTIGFVATVISVVVIAALYFYNITQWANYPNFGFAWRAATGIDVAGTITENGRQAGLRLGDRFIEVNSKTFTNIKEFRSNMNRELGDENNYLIERAGLRFVITITNIPTGFKGSFRQSGLPFMVGICYILIGTIVFLMKPHERVSWIFLIFASIFGLFLVFLFKAGIVKPGWLNTMDIFFWIFVPAVFIHLSLCLPEEREIVRGYSFLQMVPYFISALLFLRIRSLTPTIRHVPKLWMAILAVYITLGVLVFLGSCLQLRITSSSEIVKLRSRIILLGFAIAASLPLADLVANTIFGIYIVPSFNYYLSFFIVFPLSVGYSIVKHDLFDFDTIIKRTYGYILTTGAIAGVYGLFVLVSDVAFGRFEITKSPMFPLVFILGVVFFFNPIRNRAQKFIDRVFYRLEYDYQDTVQKISETMRSLLNLDQIGKSIMDTALGAMFIDSGCVMLLNPGKQVYECLTAAGEREVRRSDAALERTLRPEEEPVVIDEAQLKAGESEDPKRAFQDSRLLNLIMPADEPFIQKIAEIKKEVTIYDIQEDPFFEDQRAPCKEVFDRLEATLIVPLIYEDQLTGLISLGEKKSGKFYRKEDINLLNTLANQGAVAIENAMMIEEVIEKERMEEELSIARDLQTSMLPAECPTIEGFEIAAYSLSAMEVGGDFYDFIDMGENKAGMVIGDVTGKSVSGALVMSASRSVFRMLSEEELSVEEIMIRANRRTKKDIKSGMFVALLYAVLNAEDRTLSLCSAGQTQPIYWSSETGETKLVETKGDTFPLGILEDVGYKETQLHILPGDKVVLYTDGIVEAMNDKEEMFGFDRLLEVVQEARSMTADSLLKKILHTVNEFAGGAAQHDDLTVIVLSAAYE